MMIFYCSLIITRNDIFVHLDEFFSFFFLESWILLGIDGLGDMRPICGITVAERKGKQGKEGKVRKSVFWFRFWVLVLLFYINLVYWH